MTEVLEKLASFGVTAKQTVNTAIRAVGNKINESSNPEEMAKKIVVSLGGIPLGSKVEDVILAKALVEQAITNSESYDPEAAFAAAQAKLNQLKTSRPWAFTSQEGAPVSKETISTKKSYYKPKTNRRKGENNDKLKVAEKIYAENKTLKRGEIVALVQKELNISYANAYYYVKTLEKKAS